jgi:hypothetical protein
LSHDIQNDEDGDFGFLKLGENPKFNFENIIKIETKKGSNINGIVQSDENNDHLQ